MTFLLLNIEYSLGYRNIENQRWDTTENTYIVIARRKPDRKYRALWIQHYNIDFQRGTMNEYPTLQRFPEILGNREGQGGGVPVGRSQDITSPLCRVRGIGGFLCVGSKLVFQKERGCEEWRGNPRSGPLPYRVCVGFCKRWFRSWVYPPKFFRS